MTRGTLLSAALALCIAFAVLAVMRDWPLGEWLALAVGLVLLVAQWRERRAADAAHRRLVQALDAMQAGIALYDADDRLVVTNADFRSLYAPIADRLQPGLRFEDLLREAVQAGLVPEAKDSTEAWLAARMAQHRRADAATPMLRRMADGRWRRIVEQRLPDGAQIAFSIDVTELVENEQALKDARSTAERSRQLLVEAIEAMPAGVEIYDEQDRLIIFNQRLARMYPHLAEQMSVGHTFEALIRRSIEKGLVPAAVGNPEAWLAERLAQRARSETPMLQRVWNGAWFHVYETRQASGAVVCVRLDVTELVQQREALEGAQARAEAAHQSLEDAIEALPEGFALFDADDRLVLCNRRYREIYAASAPVIERGNSFEDIVRYGLERGQYPQAAANPAAWLADRVYRHRNPSGEPILQELEGNRWLRIDERKTRSGGIAGVRSDVTEMVQARQQLEHFATTDALTGIGNRRLFDRRLDEELRRAQRHGQPLALLMVDIDHFKRYNDRYGHPAGDATLARVAVLLQTQARRPGELVARYGGEEFALLLPHNDEAAALLVAERCQDAVAAAAIEHADSPTSAHLTLSIGVAVQRGGTALPQQDATAFLARADGALYQAKQQGRGRTVAASRSA